MNVTCSMAAGIGIILIALALIVTPVAAANTNLVMNYKSHNYLPADMSTTYTNPLLHFTPSTDLSTLNLIPSSSSSFSSSLSSSVNPFVRLPTPVRWKDCGPAY